jgi:hypothetical protein
MPHVQLNVPLALQSCVALRFWSALADNIGFCTPISPLTYVCFDTKGCSSAAAWPAGRARSQLCWTVCRVRCGPDKMTVFVWTTCWVACGPQKSSLVVLTAQGCARSLTGALLRPL